MNIFRLSLGLLVATILVVVGAQNTQSVAFHFLFWETRSMPVVLALALAVFLGALLAWIVSIPGRYRGMRSHRDLQHRAEHAEEAERAGHAQQLERAAQDERAAKEEQAAQAERAAAEQPKEKEKAEG